MFTKKYNILFQDWLYFMKRLRSTNASQNLIQNLALIMYNKTKCFENLLVTGISVKSILIENIGINTFHTDLRRRTELVGNGTGEGIHPDKSAGFLLGTDQI